jgi:hypothetical protein
MDRTAMQIETTFTAVQLQDHLRAELGGVLQC